MFINVTFLSKIIVVLTKLIYFSGRARVLFTNPFSFGSVTRQFCLIFHLDNAISKEYKNDFATPNLKVLNTFSICFLQKILFSCFKAIYWAWIFCNFSLLITYWDNIFFLSNFYSSYILISLNDVKYNHVDGLPIFSFVI